MATVFDYAESCESLLMPNRADPILDNDGITIVELKEI